MSKLEISKVDAKSVASQQNFFIQELKSLFEGKAQKTLTENQIQCAKNGFMYMLDIANANGNDIYAYPQAKTIFTLQRIVSLEWDVLQGEGAIILQNKRTMVESKYPDGNVVKDKDGNVVMKSVWEKYFDLRPTAKGHKKSVRLIGAGLRKDTDPFVADWVVYEGDEFTDIEYVGLEIKPPTYKPKRISNKVKFIVYGLRKEDGTTQWIVGHREQVKPSLLAQATVNGVPEEDLERMTMMTVDEILDTYGKKTFKKRGKYDQKTRKYEQIDSPYLNDTWVKLQNRESMLETKLRGVMANRMIDKYYTDQLQEDAFKHTIIEHETFENDNANELVEQAYDLIEDGTATEDIYEIDENMVEDLVVEEEIIDVEKTQEQEQLEKSKNDYLDDDKFGLSGFKL